MKKFFVPMMAVLLLVSCTNNGGGTSQQEIETLKQENELLKVEAQQLQNHIDVISDAVNEIALDEGIIFVDQNGSDINERRQLINHMETVKGRLALQREKIAQLEQSLANSNNENGKLSLLVSQLKAQITAKEATIADLTRQLEDNSVTISQLRDHVTSISLQLAEASVARESLENAVYNQDRMLNEAYYIVATKSRLKELGLTEGTFKKKANVDNFDKSKFTQADIRDLEMVRIPGKSPKLITPKPADSYEIAENRDGTSTLYVKDAVRFWEASKFLVIQIKD